MGITAENVAEKYGITREMQDELAYASQQKALKAIETGAFKKEILPITVKLKKKEYVFDTDEGPRADSTPEKLAKLRPAFRKVVACVSCRRRFTNGWSYRRCEQPSLMRLGLRGCA